jgi:hypothetical protein
MLRPSALVQVVGLASAVLAIRVRRSVVIFMVVISALCIRVSPFQALFCKKAK